LALDVCIGFQKYEEASPGRARVPGVMERLNRLDGELSNNGGSSVKDAIERIEKILGAK
jgi:hypothetical protein